jgi:glyoxylase-like metal-dependent hydrolase (beta-lactamase superfamily II)
VGEEWDFWKHERRTMADAAHLDDSVVPVVEAGQATLVGSRDVVAGVLRLEPSPGHTPGHTCVRLATPAGEVVFIGDLMHRTVQVAEPQWSSRFCHDPAQAAGTRRAFVEAHADSGVIVLAAHFPHPGRIVRAEDGLRFVPLAAGAAA